MRNEWILEVLADLRRFALLNGLPQLAEQLDDTALVAMAEIATLEGQRHGRDTEAGGDPGGIGAGGQS